MMKIGEIAKRSGIPAPTIRYYEKIRLLPKPERLASGYRLYGETHLERLIFLKNLRRLGFSQVRARQLVALLEEPARKSRDVKTSLEAQLREIRNKRRLIEEVEARLEALLASCKGDGRPQCAILENLKKEG